MKIEHRKNSRHSIKSNYAGVFIMQRVRKLVSVPEEIPGGQTKVTVAVLDTGECVMVLQF